MKRFSLHYTLLTTRFDQIWFPLALWVLFLIIAVLRGQDYVLDTARAYLGATVPLIAGITSAYAVLSDPALELRFATPVSSEQTLLERLSLVFAVQTFFALCYQIFALSMGVDFSTVFPSWYDLQLAWLVPTISLMALGSFVAMISAQPTTGALLVGMVWIVELVARGWFATQKTAQYFLVFMSPFMVDHPVLRMNQIALLVLSLLILLISWMLLRRQERYI